jgi:hypothetical protein
MIKTRTLEEKIASVLKADDIPPAEIGQLITEVEAAAKAADETASKSHEDALDPTKIVDATKVGAAVATAALTRDRLQAALPRLREKQKVQAEIEYSIAWTAERDKVEAMRNELVANLQRYPALAAEMIDMVQRIAPIDAMIKHSNATRPDAEHALQNTEEIARYVTGFGVAGHTGLLSLMTEMKLPKFKSDDNAYQYLWPPRVPSMAETMAAAGAFAVPEYNWRQWDKELDKRERQKEIDNDQMQKFYEDKQREREAADKVAIEKAKEADRQAYRERGWPARG